MRLSAPELKAVLGALGERDETAEICRDRDGQPEPDADLRDTETVPLKESIESYFKREVLPHVPDAWIDDTKTKVGYEIPLNRHFYRYEPPRPLEVIEADIKMLGRRNHENAQGGDGVKSQRPQTYSIDVSQLSGASRLAWWADGLASMPPGQRPCWGCVELSRAAGILVVINGVVGNNNRRRLDPAEFQRVCALQPARPAHLCERLRLLKSAQMFTLAHELPHLWLGRDGVFNLPDLQPGDSEIERFRNRVAAEVLIPERELQDCWAEVAKKVGAV